LIALDVLQGQAGDGDKTIEFEATFASSGTSNGNSCPLAFADAKRITLTLKDKPISSLTGTLKDLKTTVQEGEGTTQITNLKFSLPTNSSADANCNALAEIKVIGGTARLNLDFSFNPTKLTFGQGDGNSKNQAVNLTLLSGGVAGDGNKTIEFETTFASTGGSTGNSCPLVSATSQKTVLTIVDTEVISNLLTTSLTALVTDIPEGAGVTNIARFGVTLPSTINADANCNATAVVRVIGGTATSGVDFNFTSPTFNFKQGDGNAKTQLIALDVPQGQAGDGDKTIEFEATFASSGTSNGNSCPLAFADAKRMTLTLKDKPISSLTGTLENLKTTVQEGAGIVQLANIKFSLSANSRADANCKAVAEVKVVGGTARSGIDFRFTPVKLTYGQGDVGSKTQVVNLNLLAGKVGDGDKTIELEIMFDSLGGATGNSCPLANSTRLAKATIQKTVITIKDTPASTRPRIEVKLNDITIGVDKTSASFPVSIVQTPLNSNINCNPQVELVPSNLRGFISISPTRFNKTGNATVNIIKREPSDQVITVEAKLRVDERVCDSAGNVSAKITINAETTKPSISISASATSATEKNTVNVSYKLTGKLTSCKTINPLVVSAETTASQDQYVLDSNTNLLDTPIVAVKILKQDPNRESVLVLAAKAEGCQLDVNNTVSIRIRKKQTTTIKQEPEALNKAICLTLQRKTGISGSGATIETEIINKLSGNDRSYYISNCKQGANIRNLEPEEIASQTNAVLSAVNQQLRNVRSRLDKLRSTQGQRGLDISDATLNIQGEIISVGLLGGAAGDSHNGVLQNSRWGVFANGEYGFGSKDRGIDTAVATGDRNFDFNSTGLTIGADYRLPNEKTIVGAALGYKNTELNFTTQLGGTSTKGYNLSLYGTYLLSEKSYLDIVLGHGADRLSSSRPVNNDGSGNIGNKTTFAIGKPKATELTFSVGGGYEFNQGEWSLTPYGRIDFTKGSIKAYTESASHSSANTSMFLIDKQTIESLTSTLGIKASKIISTSNGVFIPNVSLEWKHEFKRQSAISGQSLFIKDNPDLKLPSGFKEANGRRLDKDYYTIGVGVSAVFPKGRSAYLNFESRLGDTSIEDNAVKAGFRWEF
jgi:outer membrane autotransporter protein